MKANPFPATKTNKMKISISRSLSKVKAFFNKFLPGGRIGTLVIDNARNAQNIRPAEIQMIGS